jgi:hypothetical protein
MMWRIFVYDLSSGSHVQAFEGETKRSAQNARQKMIYAGPRKGRHRYGLYYGDTLVNSTYSGGGLNAGGK